jgi:predicted DNA-binding protein (UPF0251 family)
MNIYSAMPRKKKCRRVYFQIPECKSGEIVINADEIEAIRLADVEGMDQIKAARMMGISQPTFHRILKNARKKIGKALIDNLEIKIIGENVIQMLTCPSCGHEWEKSSRDGDVMCPVCKSATKMKDFKPGRIRMGKRGFCKGHK